MGPIEMSLRAAFALPVDVTGTCHGCGWWADPYTLWRPSGTPLPSFRTVRHYWARNALAALRLDREAYSFFFAAGVRSSSLEERASEAIETAAELGI